MRRRKQRWRGGREGENFLRDHGFSCDEGGSGVVITRPLDLASKLRPEPRSFDWLFFVNGGLIAVFFYLFGSQFVLAPSLGVDFRLPSAAGAIADARPATHHVNVTNSKQIFVRDGLLTMEQLREWLRVQSKTVKEPVLLVVASDDVPTATAFEIASAARDAGFAVRFAASDAVHGGEQSRGGR